MNRSFSTPGRRHTLATAISLTLSGLACLAQAQEPILEEVIVTSQRRALSLQDVPNSVVAMSGERLEQMAVNNLQDLTTYATNIHLTQTGFSTQLRIRGIGSDNSQGFEQSVGVYADGIFRGRAQLFRAPMFDMERVEIMRGPQATLFGKNSIAGALDLISAKPTDELAGRVTLRHGLERSSRELDAFVSGPLLDNLNGRLAVRVLDDPGFMQNSTLDQREPNRDEIAVRGSLDWTPTDNLQVTLIAEQDTFDVRGRAIEVSLDQAAPGGFSFSQVLGSLQSFGGLGFESDVDHVRQSNLQDQSDNTINSLTLRADYDWNGFTLTSLTGALGFDYTETCDCDFTPSDLLTVRMGEKYDQLSQEFRIASPTDQRVEWLAGIFYQTYEQTFEDTQGISSTSLVPFLLPELGIPGLDADTAPRFENTGIMREFEQNSETAALFGEVTWNATDTLHLSLGLRYTHEVKDASKVLNVVRMNTDEVLPSPGLGELYSAVFLADSEQSGGHNLQDRRSESAFTPSFTAVIDLSDTTMAYGKISRGFKSGGFDPRSNNTENFEFEEERVDAFEVGYKIGLAEGRAEVNFALFRMHYDNLQISQFDGRVGFNVGNARDTRVQGLELDGRWQITEHLLTRYSAALLDFEYRDFTNGDCHYGLGTAGVDLCDYTGERGVYTPKLAVNGGFDYVRPLNERFWLTSSLDLQWMGEHQVHVNLDPQGAIDAYTLVSLRFALETENWELALLGKNLLDEKVVSYSANLPLSELMTNAASGEAAGSNSHYSFVRPPRSIVAEATYRF